MRLIVGSIRGRYPRKPLWLLAPPRNILPIDNDSRLAATMIPILFHLGPLTVYSFGMMMALGFLAADYVIRLECQRRGFDPEYSSSVVITAAVVGIVGSRIYAIMDDFFRFRIRLLRRHDRRNPWRIHGFALVSDFICGDDGHVCAGARDWAGDRANGMPAGRRRRLGIAIHLAVGDGVSEGDRRLELGERAQA